MAIPWNEDDPRDAALIIQNLTNLLRQIYKGARLPVPYYVGEVRDIDSRFPELRRLK